MPRTEEAKRLVDEGAIYIVYRSEIVIESRVDRNKEGRAYHTFVYWDGTAACNCDLGYSRTTDLCAHALAVRMVVEKEAE